jgi:hypothetical protein
MSDARRPTKIGYRRNEEHEEVSQASDRPAAVVTGTGVLLSVSEGLQGEGGHLTTSTVLVKVTK